MLDKKVDGHYPFTYTPSTHTDLRATFKKERQRILEGKKPPKPQPVRKEHA